VRLLLALGGNALSRDDQRGTWEEQRENARLVARLVARLHRAGHRVVLTHGNGPQVGALALQQRAVSALPHMPLDALVAMTQGQIGYLLQQVMGEEAPDVPTATLLTRVVVDPADPAFAAPTKPIGPFYSEGEAEVLARANGWTVGPDSGRGWRRMVASPVPRAVCERDQVALLARHEGVIIAGGGGGVPVVPDGAGFRGVEAVVDKDRCALVLARDTGCDVLALVTGVRRVALDFGTRWQRDLAWCTAGEARRHLEGGEFPPGSMGPKVEAAAAFAEAGGRAVITSPEALVDAIAGDDGTWIVPDAEGPAAIASPLTVAA
jgi:carbamate kinase